MPEIKFTNQDTCEAIDSSEFDAIIIDDDNYFTSTGQHSAAVFEKAEEHYRQEVIKLRTLAQVTREPLGHLATINQPSGTHKRPSVVVVISRDLDTGASLSIQGLENVLREVLSRAEVAGWNSIALPVIASGPEQLVESEVLDRVVRCATASKAPQDLRISVLYRDEKKQKARFSLIRKVANITRSDLTEGEKKTASAWATIATAVQEFIGNRKLTEESVKMILQALAKDIGNPSCNRGIGTLLLETIKNLPEFESSKTLPTAKRPKKDTSPGDWQSFIGEATSVLSGIGIAGAAIGGIAGGICSAGILGGMAGKWFDSRRLDGDVIKIPKGTLRQGDLIKILGEKRPRKIIDVVADSTKAVVDSSNGNLKPGPVEWKKISKKKDQAASQNQDPVNSLAELLTKHANKSGLKRLINEGRTKKGMVGTDGQVLQEICLAHDPPRLLQRLFSQDQLLDIAEKEGCTPPEGVDPAALLLERVGLIAHRPPIGPFAIAREVENASRRLGESNYAETVSQIGTCLERAMKMLLRFHGHTVLKKPIEVFAIEMEWVDRQRGDFSRMTLGTLAHVTLKYREHLTEHKNVDAKARYREHFGDRALISSKKLLNKVVSLRNRFSHDQGSEKAPTLADARKYVDSVRQLLEGWLETPKPLLPPMVSIIEQHVDQFGRRTYLVLHEDGREERLYTDIEMEHGATILLLSKTNPISMFPVIVPTNSA